MITEPCILGLDLDTYVSGYAFLSLANPVRLLSYGTVTVSALKKTEREDILIRWSFMAGNVLDVCRPSAPLIKAIAIEEPNCFSNGETTRQLCGLFGIISHKLYQSGWFPTPVNTAHAKRVFCGKGGGGKDITIQSANLMFGTRFRFDPKAKAKHRQRSEVAEAAAFSDDDIADAIQAAFTLRKDLIETEGSGFDDLARGG